MKRKQRTEVLIQGERGVAARFAKEIADRYEVVMIEQPNNGLVMVKSRETAKRSLFYLGEVFVTECKVRIEHAVGLGIVSGHDPELAYDLAVIDAAYEAGFPETAKWETELNNQAADIDRKRKQFQSKVLRTKVNFETMDDGE